MCSPDDVPVAIFAVASTRLSDGAKSSEALGAETLASPARKEAPNATVEFIAARHAVPDQTPSGPHHCDRGGQSARRGRLTPAAVTVGNAGGPAAMCPDENLIRSK
jgi:hypothetical protein